MPRAALVLLVTLAVPSGIPAAAQTDTVELSLEQAESLALERGFDARIARETVALADAGVAGSRGPYDPALRVDARYRDRTDPINSVFSGAPPGEVGPEFRGAAAQAEVTQLLPSGGSLSLSTSLARQTADSLLVQLTPAYETSLGVAFTQPLLRQRRVDPARTRRLVARTEARRSRELLEAQLAESLAAVDRAYWDLVAARRDLAVRESSVALAERQTEETRARIDSGDLAESDLAEPRAEVQRRNVERLTAEEHVVRAENALKALILADGADPWWRSRLVPGDSPETPPREVALEVALAEARASRAEIAAARSAVARIEREGEAARNAVEPRLDLVAGYALRGLAGEDNPQAISIPGFSGGTPSALSGGLGRSWGTIRETRFPDASLGLALSVPLRNHAARADVAAVEARRRQATLLLDRQVQRVELEVRNAVAALATAEQRIVAAGAGRDAAETQLRVAEERFAVGATTNFVVLTRQNDLARARVVETAALTDYRKALTEVDRARGRLLAERGIAVEEGAER